MVEQLTDRNTEKKTAGIAAGTDGAALTPSYEKEKPLTPEIPPKIAEVSKALDEHAKEKEKKKHEKTWGETIFDRVVYTGIGFALNEGISLIGTYYATDHNNRVRHTLDHFADRRVIKKLAPEVFSNGMYADAGKRSFFQAARDIFKNPGSTAFSSQAQKILAGEAGKDQRKRIHGLAVTALLNQGGNVLLVPMKLLEDSKAYWVRKGNHVVDWLRGGKLTPEEVAARDAKVDKYIAAEPDQSWWSLIMGRLVVSGVNIGLISKGIMENPHIKSEKIRGEYISRKTGTFFTESLQNSRFQPLRWLGNRPIVQGINKLLVLETFFCLAGSIMLEVTSKLIARGKFKGEEVNGNGLPKPETDLPPSDSAPSDYPAPAEKPVILAESGQRKPFTETAKPTTTPSAALTPAKDYRERVITQRDATNPNLNLSA